MRSTASLSSAKLAARTSYRRAVEAAIWGMPTVHFDAMRQAYFRDAGARYNDIVYWSRPADWHYQIATPNSTAVYAMFFVNLVQGPVIVHVPRAADATLSGSLVDSWNLPLIDVGSDGEDRGAGGNYALLPPDHSPTPEGCVPVPSATYNVFSLMQVVPRSGSAADLARSIAHLERLRLHQLSGSSILPRLIDIPGRLFEGTAPCNASFYTSLARMVIEEPIKPHDLAFMGQLHSLGIGKNVAFSPDAAMKRVFAAAIQEARAHMAEGFRAAGFHWWPHRQWKFILDADVIEHTRSYMREDRLLIDQRAHMSFGGIGAARDARSNLLLKAFDDSRGRPLNGTHTYRLHVPPDVPTRQFWSLTAYDSETAAFIRKAPVVGIDSFNTGLTRNADGSVDIYFAPVPQPGWEANWISTAVNRPFFSLFRNHAAHAGVVDRTHSWVLDDIERVDHGGLFPRL